MTRRTPYTRYPRTILWLVPGGALSADVAGVTTAGDNRAEVAPFYLSKWPITNEQYEAFDPRHRRAASSPGDRDSAVGVTFEEALAYCEWYAELSRKPIRLPTEREWEYACRGGSADFLPSPARVVDEYAWHAGNAGGRARPPEQKKPNGFGLHGMSGGVWEWTVGESGPVLRGGSFRTPSAELGCRLRRTAEADLRADDIGFRVVKEFGAGW